jgi:TetR/AcrR family transcriptional repressor of nem operon
MAIKQSDETREKILSAAFCEMHRNGFQAASIGNILADTGLTKGALYHHFDAKQALGLAVVEEVIGPRLDGMVFRPLRESDHPIHTLLEIIDDSGANKTIDEIKLGCPLNNLMQEMSPLDDAFKEKLSDILKTWRRTVSEALEKSQKNGEVINDVDCKAAALFIVASWEGCIGTAKSLQSLKAFRLCMHQLHGYIAGLMTGK